MMDNLKNIANEMEKNNQTTKPVTKDGVKGVLYIQDRSTEPRDVIMFSSLDQNEINVGIEKHSNTVPLMCDLSLISSFIYRLLRLKTSTGK